MIYKIKIKNKESKDEYFVIMGDSYKPFIDHFGDIISKFAKKWHYASEDKYAKCYGRTLTVDFLELYVASGKFVSFGGLKMCREEFYNKEVEEHNENAKKYNDKKCQFLEELSWRKDNDMLKSLLKSKRVISEEDLIKFANSVESEVKNG